MGANCMDHSRGLQGSEQLRSALSKQHLAPSAANLTRMASMMFSTRQYSRMSDGSETSILRRGLQLTLVRCQLNCHEA